MGFLFPDPQVEQLWLSKLCTEDLEATKQSCFDLAKTKVSQIIRVAATSHIDLIFSIKIAEEEISTSEAANTNSRLVHIEVVVGITVAQHFVIVASSNSFFSFLSRSIVEGTVGFDTEAAVTATVVAIAVRKLEDNQEVAKS